MNICKRLFSANNLKNGISTTLLQKSTRILPKYDAISMSSLSQMEREKEEFHKVLPNIVDDLLANPIFLEIPNNANWVKKLLFHNVTGGKNTRGLTTVLTYEMLERPGNVTQESLRLARTLGWCVEMLQAYFVILDDIMDGSSSRRGVPCWYRMPDVGIGCAINDSIIMHSSLFQILRANFSNKLNYVNMFHAFNETILYTTMGQHLDYKTSEINNKDYSLFTMDRCNAISVYKSGYYTIKLPIILGLLLSNYEVNQETAQKINDICLEIGFFFQTQDDFIDCYGDETATGKAGTDIQEGKCTWLAVTALQRCTEAQRVVFTSCYGSKEPAHMERIKLLYDQLDLPKIYKQQERANYETILNRILKLPTNELRMMFCNVLNILYKRKT